jgi:hypothetical protein
VPMRVIAKKRCRAMVEPPEKGERATLNPNLSTRLEPTFFRSGPWAAGWLLLVEKGERRCLAVLRGRKKAPDKERPQRRGDLGPSYLECAGGGPAHLMMWTCHTPTPLNSVL